MSIMKTILIIDDDEDVCSLVKRMLEREKKYTVLAALSGPAGLELAKKKNADLILLDFAMPDMNGLEFLKSEDGFKLTRVVPVILLTGVGMSDEETREIQQYADGYLAKPVDREKLLYAVETMLVRGSRGDQAKHDK
jgi:CheY-like chemotaxis protein